MSQIRNVDRFEGHPYFYERITVTLEDRHGESFEGLVYIMNPNTDFAYPCPTYLPGVALTMATYYYLHDEPFDYYNFNIEVVDASTGASHDTYLQRLDISDYPEIVRSKIEKFVL